MPSSSFVVREASFLREWGCWFLVSGFMFHVVRKQPPKT